MKKKVFNREEQQFQLINSGSYIEDKLKELDVIADEIIKFAIWRIERNPETKDFIFKETKDWLIYRIGHGSIGPATAATSPLLEKKLKELESKIKKKE